ncbi:MAG: hypothetical protein JNN31_10465 [Dechloromonas sp.]|nr:hypothetical protein [Dechloromonas sp.]
MTEKTTTAAQPSWQRAALEKFYVLKDMAGGHRASASAHSERFAEALRSRRLLDMERVGIIEHMSLTRGDTKNSERRIDEIDHELQRLDNLIASLEAPRALAIAKIAKSALLVERCGNLLVAIGLLSREEVLL